MKDGRYEPNRIFMLVLSRTVSLELLLALCSRPAWRAAEREARHRSVELQRRRRQEHHRRQPRLHAAAGEILHSLMRFVRR